MTTRYVRYVRNYDVERMMRRGWTVHFNSEGIPSMVFDHHGHWSTIMEWKGYWYCIGRLTTAAVQRIALLWGAIKRATPSPKGAGADRRDGVIPNSRH